MRRDPELLTKILLALEADEPVGSCQELTFLDADRETIIGHLNILAEKNMIRGDHFGASNVDPSQWPWHNISLRDAGHDALAATRTNKAGEWWRGQAKAAGKMATPTLIAQVVAHPEDLQRAAEAIIHFMKAL